MSADKSKSRYLKKFVGLRAGEEQRYLRRAGVSDTDDALQLRLRTCLYRDLSATEKERILQLCEENMRALYEATWGWDERKKRDELSHVAARFLLMYDMQGELVGFTHFRFTWDDEEDGEEVVGYIYELQIVSSWQGRGIGRKSVDVVRKITAGYGLNKCMLTCLRQNEPAMRFYQRVGFVTDPSSPSVHGGDEVYEILSITAE